MDADGTDVEEGADFDGQAFPVHILSVRPPSDRHGAQRAD